MDRPFHHLTRRAVVTGAAGIAASGLILPRVALAQAAPAWRHAAPRPFGRLDFGFHRPGDLLVPAQRRNEAELPHGYLRARRSFQAIIAGIARMAG